MKNIYRKSALDKLSSVDQLDKALKITSPYSWLALIGITGILIVTLIWSIWGILPSTVTATGVLVYSDASTNTILSTQRGTVQRILKGSGAYVQSSDDVLISLSDNGTPYYHRANQDGYITDVLIKPGDIIDNGTELMRLRPRMYFNQKHVVVCYVPITDADKIRRGQEAHVTLTSANSSLYGFIKARVTNVDTWATSSKAMEAVVGGDNSMVQQITNNGNSVCAVTCELYFDESTGTYGWSTERGKSKVITAPQMCSVQIITETNPPITKLFTKLKDILENRK